MLIPPHKKHRAPVAANYPAKLCKGALIFQAFQLPPSRPSSPGLLQSSCGTQAIFSTERSLPGSCPLALRQDASETYERDTSPRRPKLARGVGEEGGHSGPPPRGSLPAPGRPARARPPVNHTADTPPTRARNTARGFSPSRLRPGRAAAACPLPGAGNGGGRLPRANSVLAPSPLDPTSPSSSG